MSEACADASSPQDLGGFALGTMFVIDDVRSIVNVSLPNSVLPSDVTLKLVATDGTLCCTGASQLGTDSGDSLDTHGAVVVTLPSGTYKPCFSLAAAPIADSQFSLLSDTVVTACADEASCEGPVFRVPLPPAPPAGYSPPPGFDSGETDSCGSFVTDLTGISLNTTTVLEETGSVVTFHLPDPEPTHFFAKFLAAGNLCCTGASSSSPTTGGRVDGGEVAVTLAAGFYKVCVSRAAAPVADAFFVLLPDALLASVITPPPPPPPLDPPPSPLSPIISAEPISPPPSSPPLFSTQSANSFDTCLAGGDSSSCFSYRDFVYLVIGLLTLVCTCVSYLPLRRWAVRNGVSAQNIISTFQGTMTVPRPYTKHHNRRVGKGGVGAKALDAVLNVLRHPVVICLLITSVIAAAFVLYGFAHFGSVDDVSAPPRLAPPRNHALASPSALLDACCLLILTVSSRHARRTTLPLRQRSCRRPRPAPARSCRFGLSTLYW